MATRITFGLGTDSATASLDVLQDFTSVVDTLDHEGWGYFTSGAGTPVAVHAAAVWYVEDRQGETAERSSLAQGRAMRPPPSPFRRLTLSTVVRLKQ